MTSQIPYQTGARPPQVKTAPVANTTAEKDALVNKPQTPVVE